MFDQRSALFDYQAVDSKVRCREAACIMGSCKSSQSIVQALVIDPANKGNKHF